MFLGLENDSFVAAQWLFVKLIALCYLVAFSSLYVQCTGLWGRRGITPIRDLLNLVEGRYGCRPFWRVPTVFWWKSTDLAIRGLAVIGIVLSVLLLLGLPAAPLLFLLWLAYLSFVTVGSEFLAFQWDILLLEVGFLAVALSVTTVPVPLLLFALWFVLFRLMFSSGVVKLTSRCPEWRGLTAMDYHYETQPLPTRWAWYVHQFPSWVQKGSVLMTFALEMVFPFLIFTPTPLRLIAFASQLALQVMIIVTGNYAFFNLLTISLIVLLLPDRYLQSFTGDVSLMALPSDPMLTLVLSMFAVVVIYLNALQLAALFSPLGWWGKPLSWARQFYLCSPYGLFARMTTTRDEIIIEGSDDGDAWRAYVLHWKPQDLREAPRRVAPHQPRLDWQLWFAALSRYEFTPWFPCLIERLLEGSPDVLALFRENPFPEQPPKYLRARRCRYHFSDIKSRRETGCWWTSQELGLYSPILSLKDPL